MGENTGIEIAKLWKEIKVELSIFHSELELEGVDLSATISIINKEVLKEVYLMLKEVFDAS